MKITKVEKKGNVCKVHIDGRAKNFESWHLLRADVHFDSTHCKHDLVEKHLKPARDRGAGVFDFVDLFDVMQGPGDKRGTYGDLRAENKRSDYFNSVVEEVAAFHKKYAKNLVFQSYGNHETSVLKRTGVDLIRLLKDELSGSPLILGGYSGWVHFVVHLSKGKTQTFKLWYIHGYGGESAVNVDIGQGYKQMTYVHDADMIVSGHTHQSWVNHRVWTRTIGDRVVQGETTLVKLPTYKDEYEDGKGGWHIEQGKSPRPLGAYWLRLAIEDGKLIGDVVRAR